MNRYLLRQGLTAMCMATTLFGCGSIVPREKPTMSVGLAYAKTDGNNYINSGNISFGTLYVWDRNANTSSVIHIYDQNSPTDLAKPIPAHHQEHRLSDGFTVDFTATGSLKLPKDDAEFKAQYQSTISSQSTVILDNLTTQRYRDAYKFLNGPTTAAARAEVGKDFGADRENVRFIFVWGQLLADKAQFAVGRDNSHEITLSVPGHGGIAFKAVGTGVNFAEFEGKSTPVLLEMQVLKLTRDPETEAQNGTGWRFMIDTANNGKLLTDLLRGTGELKRPRI